jgi:hypothetical protein
VQAAGRRVATREAMPAAPVCSGLEKSAWTGTFRVPSAAKGLEL